LIASFLRWVKTIYARILPSAPSTTKDQRGDSGQPATGPNKTLNGKQRFGAGYLPLPTTENHRNPVVVKNKPTLDFCIKNPYLLYGGGDVGWPSLSGRPAVGKAAATCTPAYQPNRRTSVLNHITLIICVSTALLVGLSFWLAISGVFHQMNGEKGAGNDLDVGRTQPTDRHLWHRLAGLAVWWRRSASAQGRPPLNWATLFCGFLLGMALVLGWMRLNRHAWAAFIARQGIGEIPAERATRDLLLNAHYLRMKGVAGTGVASLTDEELLLQTENYLSRYAWGKYFPMPAGSHLSEDNQ